MLLVQTSPDKQHKFRAQEWGQPLLNAWLLQSGKHLTSGPKDWTQGRGFSSNLVSRHPSTSFHSNHCYGKSNVWVWEKSSFVLTVCSLWLLKERLFWRLLALPGSHMASFFSIPASRTSSKPSLNPMLLSLPFQISHTKRLGLFLLPLRSLSCALEFKTQWTPGTTMAPGVCSATFCPVF